MGVKERSDRAREIIDAVVEVDPGFRKAVGRKKIRYIASGTASDVFTLGRDRVIKVISHPAILDDCEVASLLWDEGPTRGWPIIYDFAEIDTATTYPLGWDYPVCIAIVEKVTPGSEMKDSDQRRLLDVLDRIEQLHNEHLGHRHGQKIELNEIGRRWLSQLADGLTTIDRWNEDTSIDTWCFNNVGLNRRREAVWVDFGV